MLIVFLIMTKYVRNHTLDIDECTSDLHNCDNNAECEDSIGSYSCTCIPGYSGDGYICSSKPNYHDYNYVICTTDPIIFSPDVNECEGLTHNCNESTAYCEDTDGSYVCICSTGYSGDGDNCSSRCTCVRTCAVLHYKYIFQTVLDINECIQTPYPCDFNAMCIDTDGSYSCSCNTGYEGNGFQCTSMCEMHIYGYTEINDSLPLQMWMNVQIVVATTAVRMDIVLTPLEATHVCATVDSLEMDPPVPVHNLT